MTLNEYIIFRSLDGIGRPISISGEATPADLAVMLIVTVALLMLAAWLYRK